MHYALDNDAQQHINNQFISMCAYAKALAAQEFIDKHNTTLDINYQNQDGTTALLNAAGHNNWQLIWYLLENKKPNVHLKDIYQQSLFSKAVHHSESVTLKTVLKYYTPEQMHDECINVNFNRDNAFQIINKVHQFTADVLDKKKPLEARHTRHFPPHNRTALHKSVYNSHLPIIIELLEREADLEAKDSFSETPLRMLLRRPGVFFVLREVFNETESVVHEHYIFLVLSHLGTLIEKTHELSIPQDIITIIQTFFIRSLPSEKRKSVERNLWKAVLTQACECAKIHDTNPTTCLDKLMQLPQHEKTAMNIKLFMEYTT